jgi:hypothetical protein
VAATKYCAFSNWRFLGGVLAQDFAKCPGWLRSCCLSLPSAGIRGRHSPCSELGIFLVGLGFELRPQMFYHLTHRTSPFYVGYFWDRVSQTICLDWPWTVIFPTSAFWSRQGYRCEPQVCDRIGDFDGSALQSKNRMGLYGIHEPSHRSNGRIQLSYPPLGQFRTSSGDSMNWS